MDNFRQPLTAQEEAKYVRLLKQGSEEEMKEAKERLIEHNLRLVAHIVKKYQNVNEDMDDLLSIGSIGLIKAVDTFDAGKGRLATYACRCIDNELLMLLRSKKKSSGDISLFDSIGQDKEGNEIRLMDVIRQSQPDVVEELEKKRMGILLEKCLRTRLSPREREIIILRYGLFGKEPMTQNLLGEKLGISRSYVSRIEKRALGKLKEALLEAEHTG